MRCTKWLLLAWALISCAVHATVVGRIEAKGGSVERFGLDGHPRTTSVLAHIEIGDVFVTGPDGWVVLSMTDSASLTLKPNSHMRIGDYTFTPDEPKKSRIWLDLLVGSLRSITGLIGHSNPEAYAVNTPTVTMGIRGTDHEILVVDHAQDGTLPGTYDHVYQGRTVMRSIATDLELQAGETGEALIGKSAPHKLAAQPEAYTKLQQFSADHGIDKTLETLHHKSSSNSNDSKASSHAAPEESTSNTATAPHDSADDKKAGSDADTSKHKDDDTIHTSDSSDQSKGKEHPGKDSSAGEPSTPKTEASSKSDAKENSDGHTSAHADERPKTGDEANTRPTESVGSHTEPSAESGKPKEPPPHPRTRTRHG